MDTKLLINNNTAMPISDNILKILLLVLTLVHEICKVQADFNVETCIQSERDALLKLKQGFIDPSGRLSTWMLGEEDCCSWVGVGCDNKTGHVTRLDLRNPVSLDDNSLDKVIEASLSGEISDSLLKLDFIEHLDLSRNAFAGIEVPNFFGYLRNLKYLNLGGSGFKGKVPNTFGNLSRLEYLDLSWNVFIVDNLTWVTKFSSLEYLDLSNIDLFKINDWLSLINMIPSLQELHLSNCYLSSIPSLSLVNLTSLVVLDLGGNNALSTLPSWLFNLSKIQHLDLKDNSFRGTLSNEIGKLDSLVFLDLSDNMLEGGLPKTLGNLCHLEVIKLRFNQFSGGISGPFGNSSGCVHHNLKTIDVGLNYFMSGKIPNFLGRFSNLENLILESNSFEGPIPVSIGRLRHLKELLLGENHFNENIPESIGQLSNLEILDVHNNKLNGTMSALHFSNFTRLTSLILQGNSLALNISSNWVAPFQLQRIAISSCKIGANFPQWLQTQKSIASLEMANSSISGDLPNWFETISSSITKLDLSHNLITGRLPNLRKSVDASPQRIFLQHNRFDGPLTTFPSTVVELDISNNNLSGQIPQDIIQLMPRLAFLSVENNQLNGTVPLSFCDMKDIVVLDLSKNKLSGNIPHCWTNSANLKVIDLSFNSLSGQIPASFGSLEQLLSLHLQGNRMDGKIPTSLGNLNNLRTLDLSKNSLTGVIPSWIGNMSSLTIINLQSNMFRGEIPRQLCQIASLSILNLADNKMTGAIPVCFDNITALNSTDMIIRESSSYYSSISILNGSQPAVYDENIMAYVKGIQLEYTSTLPFLCSIDLSSNNFVGWIPKSLMSLSAVRNLNLSRNNLVGEIPPNIGGLKSLESLDLSRNELSGSIPESITDLNFLSRLDLSYNHLSGRIPLGKQLQALDDKSIYVGNNGLCGFPLEKCEAEPSNKQTKERSVDGFDIRWFICSLGLGFLFGFVGFCSFFYFNDAFRYSCIQLFDNVYDKLYVTISTSKEKLKAKFRQQHT